MNRPRSPVALCVATLSVILLADPARARAQDPRDPQLPESSQAPPSSDRRDRDDDRGRLMTAEREIEILQARIAVRKAEIEEIRARSRRRQAEEALSALVADNERFLLNLADVNRASVPFPDTITIENGKVRGEVRNPAPRVPSPGGATGNDALAETERRVRKVVEDAVESQNRPLIAALDKKLVMAFPDKTALEDVLKYIRTATKGPNLPNGIPIFVDPEGVADPEARMRLEVSLKADDLTLRDALTIVLRQANLSWTVKNGMIHISSPVRKGVK